MVSEHGVRAHHQGVVSERTTGAHRSVESDYVNAAITSLVVCVTV